MTLEKGFGACVGVFQANLEDIVFEDRKQDLRGQGGWNLQGRWLACCLGVVVVVPVVGGEA